MGVTRMWRKRRKKGAEISRSSALRIAQPSSALKHWLRCCRERVTCRPIALTSEWGKSKLWGLLGISISKHPHTWENYSLAHINLDLGRDAPNAKRLKEGSCTIRLCLHCWEGVAHFIWINYFIYDLLPSMRTWGELTCCMTAVAISLPHNLRPNVASRYLLSR